MPRNPVRKCANCTNIEKRNISTALGNINRTRERTGKPLLTKDVKICQSCWLKYREPTDAPAQRGRPRRDVPEAAGRAAEPQQAPMDEDVEEVGPEHPAEVERDPDDLPDINLLMPDVEIGEFLDADVILNYPERYSPNPDAENLPGPSVPQGEALAEQRYRDIGSSSSESNPDAEECVGGVRTRAGALNQPASDSGSTDSNEQPVQDDLTVRMPPSTEAHCFICHNARPGGRNRIPDSAVLDLWLKMKIYLPLVSRCCYSHLDDNECRFSVPALVAIENLGSLAMRKMTEKDAGRLISLLTVAASKPPMDFSSYGFQNDSDYFLLTGLKKEEFNAVLDGIKGSIKTTEHRDAKHALAIFLMYLRLNVSQQLLAVLFSMPQQRVSDVIRTIRNLLMKHFVPHHLGYKHITREDYIKHHTTLASTICASGDEKLVVILDGTYFYSQKSANYKLQRELFSMHKGRPLTKAMMVVAPDGYILEVEALYKANGDNNDASILKDMVWIEGGFMSFFKEGDIIIYDRGFRDCSALARRLNLETRMPHFLPKGQKQHSTDEANDSRLTTALRWVVESANGRLKRRWKFLDGIIENKHLPNLGDYIKIACSLLNAFFVPLKSDNPGDKELAEQMLERATMRNLLKQRLEDMSIPQTGSTNWIPITDDVLVDFPRISEEEIRHLTFGIYQLKQAKSYTGEHFKAEEDRTYDLFQANETKIPLPATDGLIKFKMQSRHTSSTQHQLWIHYEKNGEGRRAVRGWYCKCKAGSRILGCCAHVTAVVWYLGFARYMPILRFPAADIGRNLRDARNRERTPEIADDANLD